MKRFKLSLTLRDDVVFSERAASEGSHRSLDYIPGIALLGACAAQIYTHSAIDSYRVFHSGKVRFGNAYPVTLDGNVCLPVPLSWHHMKRESPRSKKQDRVFLQPDKLYALHDTAEKSFPDGEQPKQLRAGYISTELEVVRPASNLSLKTAIDPATGRAATAQLFGYQAIEAGQRFVAYLDLDDNVSAQEEALITESLNQTLYLGRSRSAQYGRVDCTIEADSQAESQLAIDAETTTLHIWLLSDLALSDLAMAEPVTADRLCLPGISDAGWLLDRQHSFVRYRAYSPYNGFRRSFDLERQVLQQGSVLTFRRESEAPLSGDQLAALQKLETSGIGLYRESGLGKISINHPLLQKTLMHQMASENTPAKDTDVFGLSANPPAEPESTLLLRYIQASTAHSRSDRSDRKLAEELAEQLSQMYHASAAYAGLDAGAALAPGPTPTQWSRVAEVGRQFRSDRKQLFVRLFGDGSDDETKLKAIVCKPEDEAWSAITFVTAPGENDAAQKQRETTFRQWLKFSLSDKRIQRPAAVASLLAKIAYNQRQAERQAYSARGEA